MACSIARVGECLSSLRNEFPIVARGVKSEFQNSERIRLPHFAIGFGTRETAVRVFASGTDQDPTFKANKRFLWNPDQQAARYPERMFMPRPELVLVARFKIPAESVPSGRPKHKVWCDFSSN
jgi:hypothetical protein